MLRAAGRGGSGKGRGRSTEGHSGVRRGHMGLGRAKGCWEGRGAAGVAGGRWALGARGGSREAGGTGGRRVAAIHPRHLFQDGRIRLLHAADGHRVPGLAVGRDVPREGRAAAPHGRQLPGALGPRFGHAGTAGGGFTPRGLRWQRPRRQGGLELKHVDFRAKAVFDPSGWGEAAGGRAPQAGFPTKAERSRAGPAAAVPVQPGLGVPSIHHVY